jgi:lipoprotein-anchoring transpeptidase ErfK/SrfK
VRTPARSSLPRSVVSVVALVIVAGLALTGCGSKARTSAADAPAVTDPSGSVVSTTTTAEPCNALPAGQSAVATAAQDGQLAIYDAPGATTPVKTLTNPRLINNDPNAKVPLVFLVKDIPDAQKCQWAEVYLPVRPNGSTGWVKATDVTFARNEFRLEVRLSQFKLNVFKDDQQTAEIPIGVAKENTPTPGGLYYTTELIKTPDPSGAYGPYAFGLSGFSDTLTSFNGGPGQLGIHGTNQPSAIGTRVSHGCIRMSNDDITKLAQTLPLGTPVQIIA